VTAAPHAVLEEDSMRKRSRGSGSAGILRATAVGAMLAACASVAPGAGAGDAAEDEHAASVALAQAAMQSSLGDRARARHYYEQALSAALNAVHQDPGNARAHLVAGQAAVGVGQWSRAHRLFERAAELDPGLAATVDAEREAGWARAYALGDEALAATELGRALEHFQGADLLYQRRPEARLLLGAVHTQMGEMEAAIQAYQGALEIVRAGPPAGATPDEIEGWEGLRQRGTFNLASLLARGGRYGDAADVLAGFLAERTPSVPVLVQAQTALAVFLEQGGRAGEAEALFEQLLAREDLSHDEHMQVGLGLFDARRFERAADAFGMAARVNPYSRSAHLNLVETLFTASTELEGEPRTPARDRRLHDMYDRMLEAAGRVRDFDPLNRNVLGAMLRTYAAKAEIASAGEAQHLRDRTQGLLLELQDQAYAVSELSVRGEGAQGVEFRGALVNLSGPAGEPVVLRFTVLGPDGSPLGAAIAEVTAPAVQQAVQFAVVVDAPSGDMAGWRYERVR
jgi:tetratricopeptide (TPR) repeat protein